jgi:2-methylcitrate dehydratase PrpD
MTASQALADWAAGFRLESAPAEAVAQSRKALLNSVLTAIGGYDVNHTQRALSTALADQIGGPSRVLVSGNRLPVGMAGFVNAVMVNALGQEETHLESGTHPAETTAPIVLAEGEALGAGGRDVLEAFTVGVQVAGAVGGMALVTDDRERLAHPPSAYGSVGAAAAVAKLHKLTPEQTGNAIGLAATMAAGPAGAIKAGTGEYHYLKGTCALHANLACRLAALEAPVNPLALEGPGGFYRIWADIPVTELGDFDVAGDVARYVANHWVAPELFFKRYPVNYFNQEFIDQAKRLATSIDKDSITAVRVRIGAIPAEVGGLTTAPFGERSRAMMSTRFGVACILARGQVTLADTLAPDAEDILHFVRLIDVVADSGDTAVLEIDAGGQTHGGPLTPEQRDFRLTEDELCEIGNRIAAERLGPTGAAHLVDLLKHIEQVPDITEVISATIPAR